ncbi:MAG: sigma-70 family RNA polymerase sigma factor [Planctomycetaceae bacterium]|nr:MAG: sigma-70 family RNA polymerase sigma factor [Planctomycetaceae bacterium]
MTTTAGEVTQVLRQVAEGTPEAIDELVPLVYAELRSMASVRLSRERPDHTLQPTALVHEVFLKLLGHASGAVWNDRRHFFRAAAEAMRRLLIDSARARRAAKRRGTVKPEPIEAIAKSLPEADVLLDVDGCLEQLGRRDRRAAEVVKLRLFAGLSIREVAEVLGLPRSTVHDEWTYARCWLADRMSAYRSEAAP